MFSELEICFLRFKEAHLFGNIGQMDYHTRIVLVGPRKVLSMHDDLAAVPEAHYLHMQRGWALLHTRMKANGGHLCDLHATRCAFN